MKCYLNQLKYPREFKIEPASLSDEDVKDLYELLKMLPDLDNSKSNIEAKSSEKHADNKQLLIIIVELLVIFWRMEKRIDQLVKMDELGEDNHKKISRFFYNAQDLIEANNLRVSDHTNELNTGGEAYMVVAYQPEEELTEEKVVETIKPTIYFKDKILQRGEVIVGQPSES